MARLTKLGKLVDKMLDNPDAWELHDIAKDGLKHKASRWYMRVSNEQDLEFPPYKAFSVADKKHLFPKAKALLQDIKGKEAKEAVKLERNIRYHNRKLIYNTMMKSIMGIK